MSQHSAKRIEQLLGAMTVEEKIGQLNMLTADLAVTGPGMPADYMAALKAGKLGSMLNLYGVELTRKVQRVAVEETRLGIPLFFGYDVIHGHRTVFPIPLAEAAAFDVELWERTARIAALESAAEGLMLTFAPMLDVSRDPALGPHLRERRRGHLAHRPPRRGQGARLPAAGSHRRRLRRHHRQAPGCLRRRAGRARLRPGRDLRARLPRDLSAALQGGDRGRLSRPHAGLHRSRGRADDGQCRRAPGPGARTLGLRRHLHQRLQRHRRAGPAWRRRRYRRRRRPRPQGRRRYRHDGERLHQRPAGGARARRRHHGRSRRRRAARARLQGAARPVRRSLSRERARADCRPARRASRERPARPRAARWCC